MIIFIGKDNPCKIENMNVANQSRLKTFERSGQWWGEFFGFFLFLYYIINLLLLSFYYY